MSDQEVLAPVVPSPQESCQQLDEQALARVQGGVNFGARALGRRIGRTLQGGRVLQRTQSAPARLERAPFNNAVSPGSSDSGASEFEKGLHGPYGVIDGPVHPVPPGYSEPPQ